MGGAPPVHDLAFTRHKALVAAKRYYAMHASPVISPALKDPLEGCRRGIDALKNAVGIAAKARP